MTWEIIRIRPGQPRTEYGSGKRWRKAMNDDLNDEYEDDYPQYSGLLEEN